MILQVTVIVDVDTTDTDIEDMRGKIVGAAIYEMREYPEEAVIESERTRI